MSDTYRTIEDAATAELTVEGSRFLAEASPADSREEVDRVIEAVRAREHKATHHCTAYRLGVEGDDYHYDDDGEPSGTAGPPILRQLDARDLTNVLVIVTRYFGGTELGTGGLVRAYGEAADRALSQASLVERVVRTPVRLRFEYDDTTPARTVLRRFDATIMDSQYTDVTEWTVGVRASEVDPFVDAFTNALSARGEILKVGEKASTE